MKTETPVFSDDFQRLYCDLSVFETFSTLHPVNFTCILPFQAGDPVADNPVLLAAETAHLAERSQATRLAVVDGFGECGLLSEEDAENMRNVIDYYESEFDAEFFEFMGEIYSNAGMFICALRWYRELIAELEGKHLELMSNFEGVYASVGYCLYSLDLYPEAITWSKSCIGPRQTVDTVIRALIDYEAQPFGASLQYVERAANRTRYTVVGNFDDEQVKQVVPKLEQALNWFRPFQESYLDLIRSDAPAPESQPGGYPFGMERDIGPMIRHRMNLIFALCAHADELIERGNQALGKELLLEAALLEPRAEFIQNRINALP
jgi:tetratricopeptide (TPR) repeat protein